MDEKKYRLMLKQAESLSEGCRKPLPLLANCAALLWMTLDRINWAGFYLAKEQTLYLGPFQGKHACTVIPFGNGVCGTAAMRQETVLVRNVHKFPGHIACDSASNSEIVIPLIANSKVIGVLDIDSPDLERFTETDQIWLEKLRDFLMTEADWSEGLI